MVMHLSKAVIVTGPPGSGKTTLSQRIAALDNARVIEPCGLLRAESRRRTYVGNQIRWYLDLGQSVPAGLLKEVIMRNIPIRSRENLFVFDAFPKRKEEINIFFEIEIRRDIDLAAVIILDVNRTEALGRIIERRTCGSCGAVYNLMTLRPRRNGICVRCGGKLRQRKDDTEKIAAKRFDIYERETKPVEEYFRAKYAAKTRVVEPDRSPEEIADIVSAVLDETGLRSNVLQ